MSTAPLPSGLQVERHLRADARRNRERVLEAADAVFGEHGRRAGIEDIAQRAGVGVGTVCRNFATKDELIAEVLTRRCELMLGRLHTALDAPDPATALEGYVMEMVERAAQARALMEEMAASGDFPVQEDLKARLHEGLEELVRRTQAAGALRADVRAGDIRLIVSGVAYAAMATDDPATRRRCARLVLDGLRPPAPGETPPG